MEGVLQILRFAWGSVIGLIVWLVLLLMTGLLVQPAHDLLDLNAFTDWLVFGVFVFGNGARQVR